MTDRVSGADGPGGWRPESTLSRNIAAGTRDRRSGRERRARASREDAALPAVVEDSRETANAARVRVAVALAAIETMLAGLRGGVAPSDATAAIDAVAAVGVAEAMAADGARSRDTQARLNEAIVRLLID